MHLILGLGNFEKKYDGTRHNVGFDVVDELARLNGVSFVASRQQALVASYKHKRKDGDEEHIILGKPTTYMNLSGHAAVGLRDFYKVGLSKVLVVCDDFALDFGHLRTRASGSDGGQKGLRHIIQLFGTQEIARLRLGIGPLPPNANVSAFVLARFNSSERPKLEEIVQRACRAIETWIDDGVDAAMQRYNTKPEKPKPPKPDAAEATAPETPAPPAEPRVEPRGED